MKKTQRSYNSTLRRESPKKRAERAATDPARRAYVESRWLCELCHKRRARHCHEIPRGSHRQQGVKDKALWLALCPTCHRAIHNNPACTVAWQVAVKFLSSPNECNPFTISQARGRADTAILWDDVAQHLTLKEQA